MPLRHLTEIQRPPALVQAAPPYPLVSRSVAFQRVLAQADACAAKEKNVLLVGETGTGKLAIAWRIHLKSRRARENFVHADCATLTGDLFESELYGCVKGAYTGAIRDRMGLVRSAHRGTLLFDEIHNLSLEGQRKLLVFLDPPHRFRPVGSSQSWDTDIRIIAASTMPLLQEVRAGRFIEDLYYRFRGKVLGIPPLRDRLEDLTALAERIFAEQPHKPHLEPAALAILRAHAWRGNMREAESVLENLADLGHELITQEDVKAELDPIEEGHCDSDQAAGYRERVDAYERMVIVQALTAAGSLSGAAELLKLPKQTLWSLCGRKGIATNASEVSD